MDELGRVIANLMNSLPENGTGGAEGSAPPADGASLSGPAETAAETAASAEGGGMERILRLCCRASAAGISWGCLAQWAAECRRTIIKCSF